LNQLAVSEVLAQYLQSRPADADSGMPQRVHALVVRVLSGGHVTRQELQLFIGAFGIRGNDAGRLLNLPRPGLAAESVAGSRALSVSTEHDVETALGPRRHRTLSLHDHVTISAERHIDQLRILQVIEATAETVDRVPLLTGSRDARISPGQGCREVRGAWREVAAGLLAAEILLADTLALGETTTLEYWVSFKPPEGPPEPEDERYRRIVPDTVSSYDMRIQFSPPQLPRELWWATWDGIDGGILDQQDVSLDSQHSTQRYARSLENTVAGFRWRWH